tara:strand:- start:30 stop:509 length:480 start_codon:yes stop_codon:yes gene_type:complete
MSKDKNLYTHSKQSAARLYAVQALFQMEMSHLSVKETIKEFELHRIGAKIDDTRYNFADLNMFRDILQKAVAEQSKIDKLTNSSLKDTWPLKRIDPTLRALFRAATAELLINRTPTKAVINEFIDIAKAFFPDGKESKFVNGVLDNIYLTLLEIPRTES